MQQYAMGVMKLQAMLQGFLKLFIVVLFANQAYQVLCLHVETQEGTLTSEKCNGTATLNAVYLKKQFTPSETPRFVRYLIETTTATEGDNSVTVSASIGSAEDLSLQSPREDDRHHQDTSERDVLLFTGTNSVKRLNLAGKEPSWKTIEVYCQPAGVVERSPYEIVGYCKLNTSLVPPHAPCVQCFRLKLDENGHWTDVRPYFCSNVLSTTNLTNSVILQYDGSYGFVQEFYFGERGTNILQEIRLGEQRSDHHTVPSYNGLVMNIDRIVPMRSGVRIESSNGNTPNVVYHRQYSSLRGHFVGPVTRTETTAFDSYYYDYLVSFTANRNKMVISEYGSIRQYELVSAVDNPIQCINMAGPDHHYLVCLAGNGLCPILINVIDGTSQTILVGISPVYSFGVLDEISFYLLNVQQELSFHQIGRSSAVCVGTYTIPPGVNFRPIDYESGIRCGDHIRADDNQDSSNNQSDNVNNQTSGSDQIDVNNSNFDNQMDVKSQENVTNESDIINRSNGNNQDNSNNRDNSYNQGNNSNQGNSNNQSNSQTNINNEGNSYVVVAICIGVVFIIFVCAVYGLRKRRLSSKQRFEILLKEKILSEVIRPKSPSYISIKSAVDMSDTKDNLDINVSETHDSPICQQPLEDTTPPPYNGIMIVRPSDPKLKNYSSPTPDTAV